MQKPKFVNGQIYHVYNRGVEKREIFLNDKDRFRFIHDMFEFNDEEAAVNIAYYFNHQPEEKKSEGKNSKPKKRARKLLVEILIFTLMPNHFHLLLKQKKEGGIVKFMKKLGTGYTNYFNKKYDRVGSLFQGRFKAVLVSEEAHFLHLPFYIHTNPLDIIYRSSTSITSIGWKKQLEFLENYRWSSFMDYIGKKNFPAVTSREFLLEFFGGEAKYKDATIEWLKSRAENLENIADVVLE